MVVHMDIVLLAVTALSLAMAIAMAMVLTKLLREDRARAEARVAALVSMAAEPAPASLPPLTPPALRREARPPSMAPRMRHPVASARVDVGDDLELRPATSTVTGVADLFAAREQPSPWGRRVAAIGAMAAVGAIAIAGVATRAHRTGSTGAVVAQAVPPAADVPPLELRSLHHREEAQTFVVTGIVHNPRGGAPLSRVVASAFVFGPGGAFLASGRAGIDFTALAAGEESPFVVNVPVGGRVSRYRIGFRTEDGRVIAHVDKRAPDALASK